MNQQEELLSGTPAATAAPSPSAEEPFWSHLCRVAEAVVHQVRENPKLRAEVIGLLRRAELALTPDGEPAFAAGKEPHAGEGLPGEPQGSAAQEIDACPPLAREPEPTNPAPILPPAPITEQTVQDIVSSIASISGISRLAATKAPDVAPDRRTQLGDIEKSCRLKAEACRWASERRRLIAGGADFRSEIAPKDRELITEAGQLRDCYLWMSTPSAPVPARLDAYDELADCFENAADAAELLESIVFSEGFDDLLEDALLIGAEAQSSVREAVGRVGHAMDDFTQVALFRWLRETASDQQVYIPRFMRQSDAGDPAESDALASRIADAAAAVQDRQDRRRREKNALSTIRHHAKQLAAARDNRYDWNRIFSQIGEIVPDLVKSTDVRFRQFLADKIDLIPEDFEVPPAAQSVLEAVDQFLASQPMGEEPLQDSQIIASPEILRVRQWLKGRSVVVVGGDARPYAKEALQKAFEPSEVVWVTSRAHESPEHFRPVVRAEGVGVVLLAIRWSSHCFGAVKQFCDEVNTPFVRLPAGYNPNQVAHQVMEQVPGL